MCTGQQQTGALSSSCAMPFAVATKLVMDIGTRASRLTLSPRIKAEAVPTLTAESLRQGAEPLWDKGL